MRTPAGAPDYFIAMMQDISERKRLEREQERLLQRERTVRLEAEVARAEAEATNAQLRALQALTDTALSPLALDDLLRELLARVTGVLGVDQVGILLLDADGRTLTLRAACGLLEVAPGYDQFAMGQGVPGRIAASRASLIVNAPSADDFDGAPPVLREWLHSAAGVPLLVEDPMEGQAATHSASRLVGVLVVGSATPYRFTEADVQLLQLVGDRVALAVDRARLYAAEQDARQRAEAALTRAQASEARASERAEQLHTILETMTDGVAVSGTDGRLIQTNRAFRALLAADHQREFDAMSYVDRAPLLDLRYAATGEPFPIERHPVARALRGEVVTGPEAEWRLRALDGSELEVNVSAAPLRDGAGRVVGAVSVLHDVTWRQRLEQEREAALARAQASEAQATERAERLHTILETMADGVAVYDTEGRAVQPANRAYRELLALERAPAGYEALPVYDRIRLLEVHDAATGAPLPFEGLPSGRALREEVVTGPEADHHVRAFD
ncbi:MAG TPA: PAS domain S-box protein, partial [Ktedonobacterales bacterium]|nr:PAS domain S-box protein [Ktedonobacterales bacterium]